MGLAGLAGAGDDLVGLPARVREALPVLLQQLVGLAARALRRVDRVLEGALAAIQQIRNEVADLTVLATERVTRKSLDSADQRRLVDEALSELDFAALSGEERR